MAFRANSHPRLKSSALIVTLGVGLVATVICCLSIGELLHQLRVADEWVSHSIEVLNAATTLDTDLAIVISEGHVVIVGKGATSIAPFDAAAIRVGNDIHDLRVLTSDNPVQQATLDRVEPLIVARIALLREFNDRLQASGVDNGSRIIGISQANTALMEQIFVSAEELKAEERHLLGERESAARDASSLLVNFLIGYGVLTAASGFLMTSLLMGRTRERSMGVANAELERLSRHLVRARNVAEKANRAKSSFLSGMSHELRTPLNGILGYAQLLHLEGGLNPAQSARVDAMLGVGKHLLEMITCVLDLSEIEADHIVLRPVELDVPAIAAACIDLVRPMAEAKGLALRITVAAGTSPALVADPIRLRQIMLNLLGNAAKFTSQGGVELTVRGSTDGSALRIEIADTGPGVPAGQRQHLFQDFERLDTEATRLAEGAGLGLALSARLAKLMGGSIGHHDNPNGGSVFWLELPLNCVAVTALATAPGFGVPDGEPVPAPDRALHVLVVDDLPMNRDIASSFLRSAGHTVMCAEGGAEAIAAVQSTTFDVVLMDVRMPGMDGLEAARRIRALEGSCGQVPIVALTAQALTEQVAACLAAGMDSHLPKPFDPASLLAAVMRAFTSGRPRDDGLAACPPARMPPAAAIAAIGSEFPVVDLTAFERTAGFLSPETLASHTQGITELGDSLLQRLRVPGAVTRGGEELADAAHSLAGSAGMFGFERLSAVGRQFEQAVRSGSADARALGEALDAAVVSALEAIRDLDAVAIERSA